MPNHVTNKIVIHSPNAAEVLAFIKSEKSDFDFNTLIPMPESLDIEESSTKDAAFVYVLTDGYKDDQFSAPFRHRKYFGSVFNDFSSWESELERSKIDYERIKDDAARLNVFIELGKKVRDNYSKYGCSTWYQWCSKNWGTKWNAYQVVVKENSIEFDTAWADLKPYYARIEQATSPEELDQIGVDIKALNLGEPAKTEIGTTFKAKREQLKQPQLLPDDSIAAIIAELENASDLEALNTILATRFEPHTAQMAPEQIDRINVVYERKEAELTP